MQNLQVTKKPSKQLGEELERSRRRQKQTSLTLLSVNNTIVAAQAANNAVCNETIY